MMMGFSLIHLRTKLMNSRGSLVSAQINPEHENLKIFKIGGLQIYFNPICEELTSEPGDFYSRRAGGPFYRWRLEEESGRWCYYRVRPDIMTLRGLSLASWKVVPTALQVRIEQHYLD
jgi:hypothetical protein